MTVKILITYFTVTENTEITANEIYDEILSKSYSTELIKVDEIDKNRLVE